jgi:hypothetical protein
VVAVTSLFIFVNAFLWLIFVFMSLVVQQLLIGWPFPPGILFNLLDSTLEVFWKVTSYYPVHTSTIVLFAVLKFIHSTNAVFIGCYSSEQDRYYASLSLRLNSSESGNCVSMLSVSSTDTMASALNVE